MLLEIGSKQASKAKCLDQKSFKANEKIRCLKPNTLKAKKTLSK